jgi:acyltransferase-like protein
MTRGSGEVTGSPRLVHLDNLRTLLVAWVIGGHALLGYSAVGGWAYDEVHEVTFAPATELALVALLGPSGLFVIGLFFFIAGLFVERAAARHGAGRYARDRLVRLGMPWLVSALLIWPASVWLADTVAGRTVSLWWVLTHRHPLLDSGSLWFALVLLLYSLAFAGWMAARGVPGSSARTDRPLTGWAVAAAIGAIAVSSFVVRLWFPTRSGQIADLHLWQWPQCLGMFALGILAAGHGLHRHVPDRLYRACAAVTMATLVGLPMLATASGVRDVATQAGPYLGGWHWQALATAAVEAVLVVAGSVWLVGLAERRWGRGGERSSRWAQGAFWAFVIQGPVLMAAASTIRSVDLPAEIKAPLVDAAAIMVSFWLACRLTRPGSPLGATAAARPGVAEPS